MYQIWSICLCLRPRYARKRNSKWWPQMAYFYFWSGFEHEGLVVRLRGTYSPKFSKIRQFMAELLRFAKFSRWELSAILDCYFCMLELDHLRKCFWSLEMLSTFDNNALWNFLSYCNLSILSIWLENPHIYMSQIKSQYKGTSVVDSLIGPDHRPI